MTRVSKTLLLTMILPACCTWAQQVQIQDVPASGIAPHSARNLPLNPESRSALENSLQARNFTQAETILLKEIDRSPKSPLLLSFLGGVFFLDGKYLNCAIAMKKADALTPLDDRSRFTLAMAYVTLNHRDWARPELEKLQSLDPKNALYPYWLSRLDYDAQDFGNAIRNAQRALELDPDFMKAYDNLGLCYEATGKYDQAVSAYRNAVRLSREKRPCSPWPALNLGTLLIKLGRPGEAEEALQQSLECDARFPKAHYEMGFLLEKQGKNDRAASELKQAVSLDPGYADPYYVLGRIYQRGGEPKKAAEAFSTFERLKKAAPHITPQ